MRVVTRPRVSESEKPVEKTKEEGEEVRLSFFPSWGVERDLHLLYLTRHTLYDLVYCTNYSGCFRLSRLFAIQNKFQILPVEDNWEKGVRQEFRPFSSEISSQVSRSALLVLIPSIFVLGLPSLPPCVNEDVGKYHKLRDILPGVHRGGREGG